MIEQQRQSYAYERQDKATLTLERPETDLSTVFSLPLNAVAFMILEKAEKIELSIQRSRHHRKRIPFWL